MSRVEVNGSGCWLWRGFGSGKGQKYGGFWVAGRTERAHRVAYRMLVGEIPADRMCLHRCDVKRCVNPDHLYLGTHADNMRDVRGRGRHVRAPKSHCVHGHEMTESNTIIHSKTGARSCRECSREYARRVLRERRDQINARRRAWWSRRRDA